MASRSCRMKSEIKCIQFIYKHWMILDIFRDRIWYILKTSSNLSRLPECMGSWKLVPITYSCDSPSQASVFPKEFSRNSGVNFKKSWKLALFISFPCVSVESQWPSMEHLDFIPPSQGGRFAPSCQCSTPNVRQREVSPWAQLWCMCCLVTNKLLKTSSKINQNCWFLSNLCIGNPKLYKQCNK